MELNLLVHSPSGTELTCPSLTELNCSVQVELNLLPSVQVELLMYFSLYLSVPLGSILFLRGAIRLFHSSVR